MSWENHGPRILASCPSKVAVVEHLLAHREGSEVFTTDGGKTWMKISVEPASAPEKA